MRTANRFPQERQDTNPDNPRRFKNNMICCLFSLSSMADRSLRLKILRFPSRSSSLRSTTDTSGKIACPIRVVSRYHPNFPSLALLLVSTDGVALPKIKKPHAFSPGQPPLLWHHTGELSHFYRLLHALHQ